MDLRPIGDWLIVETEYRREKVGNIYLSDKGYGKPIKGNVMRVGTGRRNRDGVLIPSALKEGDVVTFGLVAGIEFKEGDKYYRLIKEDEIEGVDV